MGSACSLIKLLNHLKQPFKCIVNFSCYTCQSSIIFLAAGIALLYYFIHALGDGNVLQRGLAVTGIVGVSVGAALLFAAVGIFIFYLRLYRAYKCNLSQITENHTKTSNGRGLNRTDSSSIVITTLDAQQNIYPYNPSFFPVAPSAPPPPTETVEITPRSIPSTWTAVLPPSGLGAGSPSLAHTSSLE